MICKNCKEIIPLDHTQVGGVHMACEDSYFYNKSVKMVKLRPAPGYCWVIMSPEEAGAMVQESDEVYEQVEVFMSKGEIENLKDFEGW